MILRGVRGGASLPPKVKGKATAGFPLTFRRLSGTLRGFTPNQTLRRKSQVCDYGDRSSWTPSSSRPPAPGARRALDIPPDRAPVFLTLQAGKRKQNLRSAVSPAYGASPMSGPPHILGPSCRSGDIRDRAARAPGHGFPSTAGGPRPLGSATQHAAWPRPPPSQDPRQSPAAAGVTSPATPLESCRVIVLISAHA